jgi:hypothetical protein
VNGGTEKRAPRKGEEATCDVEWVGWGEVGWSTFVVFWRVPRTPLGTPRVGARGWYCVFVGGAWIFALWRRDAAVVDKSGAAPALTTYAKPSPFTQHAQAHK